MRLLRQIGEPGEVADALFHLAFELSAHGEYTRGLALFEEAGEDQLLKDYEEKVLGAEDRIWRGMGQTLKRCPDVTVMLEFNASRIADPPAFARSKKESPAALRGYRKLARLAAQSLDEPEPYSLPASITSGTPSPRYASAAS